MVRFGIPTAAAFSLPHGCEMQERITYLRLFGQLGVPTPRALIVH